MAKYKIVVDKETCIGCQACVILAPELFRIGEDGKSEPIKEIIDESLLNKAKLAEENCPTKSIKVLKVEE